MHWCTSTDEAQRKLTQLCEPINCPSTDEAHARRIQEVLSNVHIVENTQHFVGRYFRKVYKVTGLEPSSLWLQLDVLHSNFFTVVLATYDQTSSIAEGVS